jgi:hypothetical protein
LFIDVLLPLAGNSALTATDAVGLIHISAGAHGKPGSENTYTFRARNAPTAFHYYWMMEAIWRECGWGTAE